MKTERQDVEVALWKSDRIKWKTRRRQSAVEAQPCGKFVSLARLRKMAMARAYQDLRSFFLRPDSIFSLSSLFSKGDVNSLIIYQYGVRHCL